MHSEAAQHADFSIIRYAQCWEDADILLPALNIAPGGKVVSICSAGDNTLSLLTLSPEKVVALDLNPAQIACLEMRIAAFTGLEYGEMLELIGVRDSGRRLELYRKIRSLLPETAKAFWDGRTAEIEAGIGHAGKFERFFSLFRRKALPLIHDRKTVDQLLSGLDYSARLSFYRDTWNNWRWKLLFKLFFSRFVVGRMGRDPSFFRYVDGSVADRLLNRVHYAFTELDPAQNPYVYWILKGTYGDVLPHALREENFDAIRSNLHKLEYRLQSVEDFVAEEPDHSIDAFNLSDIFEYMSETETERIFNLILRSGRKGARVAYWNMLVPRGRPESLKAEIIIDEKLSRELYLQDKAFFYSAFRVEELV